MPGGPQPNPTPPQNGLSVARRELMDLAAWLEQEFRLAAQPKIHNATQAEIVYAAVLGRIASLHERYPRQSPGPAPAVEIIRTGARQGEVERAG